MYSLRRWIFRPKRSDSSLLAQFFYADEDLNLVAAELDSFDGRKDPERCTSLVAQLRSCQDKLLTVVEKIMETEIPDRRASHDFRVKFPDDVLQESLAGQLWFGAECLAAGSSIVNREVESASMRPLARALTRHLDNLRGYLRDHCLRNGYTFQDSLRESLAVFDKLFAEFELSYVSAMVPVKSMREYDMLQQVTVLFCETVHRCLRLKLLDQDMIDGYDPALMFTIPRLAIVCGLLVYPEGPLNPDMDPINMSEMFRPFQTLLYKIRELLWTLTREELWVLERTLSNPESGLDDALLEQQLARLAANPNTDASSESSSTAEDGQLTVPADDHFVPGYMVHSPSTITVVPTGSRSGVEDSGSRSAGDVSGINSGAVLDNDHDQGASVSDVGLDSSEAADTINLRCLRQSLSWPPVSPSPRVDVASDIRAISLDAVNESDHELDDLHPLSCIHSGPHNKAFTFHLPRNTSRVTNPTLVEQTEIYNRIENVTRVGDVVCEVSDINTESCSTTNGSQSTSTNESQVETDSDCDIVNPSAIIFTTNGQERTLLNERESNNSQIAFVTEALNQFFVTDPSFTGVQPPSHTTSSNPLASESLTVCDDKNNNTPPATTSGLPVVIDHDSSSAALPLTPTAGKDTEAPVKCAGHRENSKRWRSKGGGGMKGMLGGSYRGRVGQDGSLSAALTQSGSSGGGECSPGVRADYDWDRESYNSSDTSSYTSEYQDDEEITLAIQAAEAAARQEARSRFKSSADLIHRLFVCVSGVADQLQTNYASDLRLILKSVFDCHASQIPDEIATEGRDDSSPQHSPHGDTTLESQIVAQGEIHENANTNRGVDSEGISTCDGNESRIEDTPQSEGMDVLSDMDEGNSYQNNRQVNITQLENSHNAEEHITSRNHCTNKFDAPQWLPDDVCPHCMACKVPFTFVRRRHHCRNCGKIFCGRCSSNSVPLPHFGHDKPVRVCNHCFMFAVTPFTVA